MAKHPNNLSHPNISPKAREVMLALNIHSGSHFGPLLRMTKDYIGRGFTTYSVLEMLRVSEAYMMRITDGLATREEKRAYVKRWKADKASRDYMEKVRKAAAAASLIERQKRDNLAKRDARRNRVMIKLARCTSRQQRLCCFGVIPVKEWAVKLDPKYASRLNYLAVFYRAKKQLEEQRKRKELINELRKSGNRLTARVSVSEDDLPDDVAPLPVLVRRYIPGARASAFAFHARMNHTLPPLEIVEGFLGHPVGERARVAELVALADETLEDVQEVTAQVPAITVVTPVAPVANVVEVLPHDAHVIRFRMNRANRLKALRRVSVREGQANFRIQVLANFDGCAITGMTEHLEAAHVVPHSEVDDMRPNNGIALAGFLHRAFDDLMFSVNPLTLTVFVDPAYRQFLNIHSAQLRDGKIWKLDRSALAHHWERFKEANCWRVSHEARSLCATARIRLHPRTRSTAADRDPVSPRHSAGGGRDGG